MTDHEPFTDEIPIGTALELLIGHQCVISEPRPGNPIGVRCRRTADSVIVVKCDSCGQGGMLPTCTKHSAMLSYYAMSELKGRCPKCAATEMKTGEPVKLPTPSAQVADTVSGAPKTAAEEFWEMDW